MIFLRTLAQNFVQNRIKQGLNFALQARWSKFKKCLTSSNKSYSKEFMARRCVCVCVSRLRRRRSSKMRGSKGKGWEGRIHDIFHIQSHRKK